MFKGKRSPHRDPIGHCQKGITGKEMFRAQEITVTVPPGTGVDLSHRVFTDFAVGVSTVFQ